jgi:hypothetical protein
MLTCPSFPAEVGIQSGAKLQLARMDIAQMALVVDGNLTSYNL